MLDTRVNQEDGQVASNTSDTYSYIDIIMGAVASQNASVLIVCSAVCAFVQA